MDRLTRKGLKQDRFALEVGHTVEYVAGHRRQMMLYAGVAVAVVILAVGIYLFRQNRHTARQAELRSALKTFEAVVGPVPTEYAENFPTQAEKDKTLHKKFSDLAANHSGTDEGAIARYYLGIMAADQGKLADAEKWFLSVIDDGQDRYASLARLSLAQVYQAQGKSSEAEKHLRYLIDHPTILVSKEQATIELGRALARTKPEEGRKLIESLRTQTGAVSRVAITALSEIPAK